MKEEPRDLPPVACTALLASAIGLLRIALVLFNHSPQEAQRGLQRKTIAKSANSLENAPF